MKTPKELRGRLSVVLKELDDLRKLDNLTDEQDKRFDELIDETNGLGEQITKAENAERAISAGQQNIAVAERLGESRGRVSGIQAQGEQGAEQQRDTRSLGQRVYESAEFEDYRKNDAGPRPKTTVGSFHEQRAIVNTPLLPSGYLQPERIPGIQRGSDLFGSLRDVLTVGQTNKDAIIFFQEASFTNGAAEVAEATAVTGSSGLKPESGFTLSQQTSVIATIAHWVAITRQMVWNAPELETYVEGRLRDGLKLREDVELLNGNGTGPNIRGLLNTSGVQVLDGTYFTGAPVADPTTPNEKFNRIARARTVIATVGRAVPNFVVLNPTDLEKFQTTTDAQKQYFGGGPMAAGIPPTIWGLRIVVSENLTAGTALVGDGRQAIIWDRMDATVELGYVNDQFIRNQYTLLAEERVGLTVLRPSAFAKVTLP